MKHVFLHGEYELSIDDKGRFLIPSEIRKRMDPERDGTAFYLVRGTDKRPWLYPERLYESLVEEEPTVLQPGGDILNRDRRMFGTAVYLEPDKQGRVLIPESARERTKIKGEFTLVGARNHLEMWRRDEWVAERDKLLD